MEKSTAELITTMLVILLLFVLFLRVETLIKREQNANVLELVLTKTEHGNVCYDKIDLTICN